MNHVVFPDQRHQQQKEKEKEEEHEHEHLKCPRCESNNTKFCYYNNYNLSQPRHYCKNCRRYWTKGGTLRNIPVGGGTRKITKRKRTSSPPTMTSSPHQQQPQPSVIPSRPKMEQQESCVQYGLGLGNQQMETTVSGGFSSLLLGFGGNNNNDNYINGNGNNNNNNMGQFGNLLMEGGNLLLGGDNGKNEDEDGDVLIRNPLMTGDNNNYLRLNDDKIGGNERGEWNGNGEIGIGIGMGWPDLSIFTQPGSGSSFR